MWMGLRIGARAALGSAGRKAIWERYRELQAGFFIEIAARQKACRLA
jgi:hypothetical protein